jgi:hypothetical protein
MSTAEQDCAVPRPPILGLCRRCNVQPLNVGEDHVIVSPRGFAHFGQNDGTTDCNQDATGSKWWWPL